MKISTVGALAVASLAVVGCGKKDVNAEQCNNGDCVEHKAAAAAPVIELTAEEKAQLMVSVNGKKLTRGEIEADVSAYINARGGQIPAEQMAEARKVIGEQMAQQFVMKTILLDEAAKKGIVVTDEDRKKHNDEFLKQTAGRPDAPKSLNEIAEKHPLGKERGLKDLEESFTIQKLLDAEVVSKIVIDPKKVEETIKQIEDNNNEMAKKALDAEAKILTIEKELSAFKGEELAKKFAEVAKEQSDCPSKEKGGDLDEFTRGMMVPEFDQVAFSTDVNVLSKPVKTQFGWHLILVTSKTPAVEAKGDTPASPEKVRASHILISARAPGKVPSKEEVENGLKMREEQMAMRKFIETLRAAAKIEAPGYPNLVPPPAEEAKPAEAKPAEAKPAEEKK